MKPYTLHHILLEDIPANLVRWVVYIDSFDICIAAYNPILSPLTIVITITESVEIFVLSAQN